MTKIIDLTGKKFGRWVVQGLTSRPGPVKYWDCACDCGVEKSVFGGDLKRGMSQSCGCLKLEIFREAATSHGMSFHPAYRNWIHAKMRCENPADDNYPQYGGRGIKVCWPTFEAFWEDMGSTWSKGLTLDRYPNIDGNYEAGNCRWANAKQQANNKRNNVIIPTPEGPMNLTQACERFGIKHNTLSRRVYGGWPHSHYFDTPQFRMPRRKDVSIP